MKSQTTILILAVLTTLLTSITVVYAQEKEDSLPFSINIPDSWAYTETPESSIERLLGVHSYSSVVLVPTEFGAFLIEEGDIEINNVSAAIVFAKDQDYSVKNAPLDLYVKFRMNKDDSFNVTSQKNTIVANEIAVRLEGNENYISTQARILDYLVLHNNEPYHIRYKANVNDYDKYLSDFEAMVKSFTFKD